MRGIFVLALGLCVSCGKPGSKDEPLPSTPSVEEQAASVEARILELSEPYGWVVSRWDDGRVEHVGDSLIWTGMAMGVMSCEGGAAPEKALLDVLATNNGRFLRHPSLPDVKTSLDGHLGVYWGIAQRVRRCPESAPLWAASLATHEPVNVTAPFGHLLTSVKYQLGMNAAPKGTAALSDAVAAWAYGVVLTKSAGYRIHLGLLSLQILENTGAGLPAAARSKFCAATAGADMQTVDHWCGRGDLLKWASEFQYNRWEYAHQRATWENPDGNPALETPGLDLLVALKTLYQF